MTAREPERTATAEELAAERAKIERARQRKGLTQQELAEQLGVGRDTVANWETNKHFPLRHAGAIEVALDIVIPASKPDEVPA